VGGINKIRYKKMKTVAKIFSFLLLSTLLYSDCEVDYTLMYTIATAEKQIDKNIGYPYLISFNSHQDAKKAKKNITLNWLDSRTVDCSNLDNCKNKLSKINNLGINNLDLGAFQHNQIWFNYEDKENYFVLKKNYKKTKKILCDLYNEEKRWDWNTIAKYHSRTPSLNTNYANNLKKIYANLIKGKDKYE